MDDDTQDIKDSTDMFAAIAMNGILSGLPTGLALLHHPLEWSDKVAGAAYAIARSMIKVQKEAHDKIDNGTFL